MFITFICGITCVWIYISLTPFPQVLGINGDAVAADILANAKDVTAMGLGGG